VFALPAPTTKRDVRCSPAICGSAGLFSECVMNTETLQTIRKQKGRRTAGLSLQLL
jgi:hypothetical protein